MLLTLKRLFSFFPMRLKGSRPLKIKTFKKCQFWHPNIQTKDMQGNCCLVLKILWWNPSLLGLDVREISVYAFGQLKRIHFPFSGSSILNSLWAHVIYFSVLWVPCAMLFLEKKPVRRKRLWRCGVLRMGIVVSSWALTDICCTATKIKCLIECFHWRQCFQFAGSICDDNLVKMLT